jgi:hypothetical protein
VLLNGGTIQDTYGGSHYIYNAGTFNGSFNGNATTAGGTLTFSVANYGAKGDGTTDDTTAIQNAINAAEAVAGVVVLPLGTYKITSALTISSPISIRGSGVNCLFGDRSVAGSDICPTVSPYLSGSVIVQYTAATNAINITVVGATVHLADFGIRFGPSIAMNDTGHGVYANPGLESGQTYSNNGLDGGSWSNIFVYGQDGNRYAFYLVNAQLMTLTNLEGYGGGGLR